MTPEKRSAAVSVMQMIQQDVESDTARREGQAFTGANVAAALGEIAAQVQAVARAVELLLTDGGGES